MPRFAAFLPIVLGIAGCASPADSSTGRYSMTASPDNNPALAAEQPAPLDPTRSIAVRDCSRPIEARGGNLSCR